MATSANKVAELVGEIAGVSGEQAQGISQINTAVTEMVRPYRIMRPALKNRPQPQKSLAARPGH